MTLEELYTIYTSYPVICTDSRRIDQGCIFFALKGESFNGNIFASKAVDDGAAFAVIDDPQYKKDDRFLLVDDVLNMLQKLALFHRRQLSIPVIGITGTNGKTTTKELFKSVLSQRYNTFATVGNLNNHIGVPLTLLSVGPEVELAIIEMGANHQKEIEFLCSLARPTHGLITNVGKAHLEGFGGFEGVKKAKGELYTFLKESGGTVFINADNEHLMGMYGERQENTVFYGQRPGALVEGRIVENDPFLTVDWISAQQVHRTRTNLTGAYNIENITAAVAVGLHFGLSPEEINEGISTYVPGNNRSQIVKTASNTVICDYYNANPSSMSVAIDNLAAVSGERKVVILGDMFELGEDADREHMLLINKVLSSGFEENIFIGEAFGKFSANKSARFYRTTAEAFEGLKRAPVSGSLVLLKGSRGMRLESLLELL
ncbi:UDP-N-acetylmuramoyl-tripeptide--D-alanyl-D-alanine ligase [Arcticibacter sp. MXS-1]|uniref:UDP-N-acetylmuramoyl-tripeptide--D-alanyl-D- alanine ligase n=1 Tax=Arcticibacter sp. MXS-1 TaxID=3341726 RepID=UPI0035A9818C